MQDVLIEVRRGALRLSTDRQHLDHAAVLALLRTTYWGGSLTPEVLARALQNSICFAVFDGPTDRKSTRLNSSHGYISYAVFCLKKKKNIHESIYYTPSSTHAAY